eukprot:6463003-Amphidinium_carterae.2
MKEIIWIMQCCGCVLTPPHGMKFFRGDSPDHMTTGILFSLRDLCVIRSRTGRWLCRPSLHIQAPTKVTRSSNLIIQSAATGWGGLSTDLQGRALRMLHPAAGVRRGQPS